MFQFFVLGESFVFIIFWVFLFLLTGEIFILFMIYKKKGFEEEKPRKVIYFIVILANLIYFTISLLNHFVLTISNCILAYCTTYIFVKSQFSNKIDALLRIILYSFLAFHFLSMSNLYLNTGNVDFIVKVIPVVVRTIIFGLFYIYLFNRYIINKKKAVSFRNNAREELINENYDKALICLNSAVHYSNKIFLGALVTSNLERIVKMESETLDAFLKGNEPKNLKNIILEKIDQKNQILRNTLYCTIYCALLILAYFLFLL